MSMLANVRCNTGQWQGLGNLAEFDSRIRIRKCLKKLDFPDPDGPKKISKGSKTTGPNLAQERFDACAGSPVRL